MYWGYLSNKNIFYFISCDNVYLGLLIQVEVTNSTTSIIRFAFLTPVQPFFVVVVTHKWVNALNFAKLCCFPKKIILGKKPLMLI